MKILHLAAGNRWTGAAAPAFAEVEALRASGVDAHYAYVGGYKLQTRLARHPYAHPIIAKAQNPVSFFQSAAAIGRLVSDHGIDLIHAHLTYDHWLARFAARSSRRVRVARTFHSRRTLRNEPFTRSLLAHTDAIFIINDDLATAPVLRGRSVTYAPPALDTDEFNIDGPDVRATYGIADDVPLLSVIGKLSPDRGFEAALQTYAKVRASIANAKLLLIGHGEHRPVLQALTRTLGIADGVIWAGYHEDDLAEHYRSADLLLFTAAGSDEGHRAVIEAMGCGVAPAVYPLEGMSSILGPLASRHMTARMQPDSLAETAITLLQDERKRLRDEVHERAQLFGFAKAAQRLVDAYSTFL